VVDLLQSAARGEAEGKGGARLPTGGGRRPDGVEATLESEDAQAISLAASAFAGIREYEPKDLTITVGAGTRLDALKETLDAEGQWLPPGETVAGRSVGGLVGASTPGPFDSAFGSVRRHVLAVRTLAPDGRELAWGRAVVKNVAGYDMVGLWCGSRGRLGIVTAASLRVWPRPERREWLELREPGDGWTLLDSLCSVAPAQDFRPDALIWSRGPDGRASALAGFLGSEVAVRTRADRAAEWASGLGYEVATRTTPERVALPSGGGLADRVLLRVGSPRNTLADLGRRLSTALGERAGELTALPESGKLTVSYARPTDPERAAALRAALFQAADSRPIAVEAGGTEELAAVEARRAPAAVSVEEAVVDALGGRPRHWLADYL
jgi:glycolate oxidase FAD binding subunit